MSRVNVFDDEGRLVGWFDAAAATHYDEATTYNEAAEEYVSLATGRAQEHERLYRTSGARWVIHQWSRRPGAEGRYRFVTEAEARTWLNVNGHGGALKELFGEVEAADRGQGRPAVGPGVHFRLPAADLERLDLAAEAEGKSRAEFLRHIVAETIADGAPQSHHTEQGADDMTTTTITEAMRARAKAAIQHVNITGDDLLPAEGSPGWLTELFEQVSDLKGLWPTRAHAAMLWAVLAMAADAGHTTTTGEAPAFVDESHMGHEAYLTEWKAVRDLVLSTLAGQD